MLLYLRPAKEKGSFEEGAGGERERSGGVFGSKLEPCFGIWYLAFGIDIHDQ